jgi:trk system potassium uptake protein TrkH
MTGATRSVTDAIFESTSGFTTTGFSVLDVTAIPQGLMFWRGITQWLGGMGVIILGVIVLPQLGAGGAQLALAEGSGPTIDRLAPRLQETAKRILLVYVAITLIQFVALWVGDMNAFDSIFHSFTTISTGGFSTAPDSIEGFSTYTQWVVSLFMIAGGVSFALHFRGARRPREYARSSDFRLYIVILVVAVAIVTGGLLRDHSVATAIRLGVFNTVSIATTTGYSSTDFGAWRPALQILLLGLMFPGGMAGSTAGAIKTFRVGVLSKAAFADVRRVVRPRAVIVTRSSGRVVPEKTVEAIQSFFLFYMMIFMSSVFLIAFIDANFSEGLDFITIGSAVASSMGTVGNGLGEIGPAGVGFVNFPDPAKLLLSGLMILGRLEIFPILVLFTRDLWKR